MRTLYCCHCNGTPTPQSARPDIDTAVSARAQPRVSLGDKYPGGELAAGQGGAEPPAAAGAFTAAGGQS